MRVEPNASLACHVLMAFQNPTQLMLKLLSILRCFDFPACNDVEYLRTCSVNAVQAVVRKSTTVHCGLL